MFAYVARAELQRDLRLEGFTFENIRDDVRRAMARQMLADTSQSITEIGMQLHYATPSAFTRSCRRWFRASPSAMRKTLLSQPGRQGGRKTTSSMRKSSGRQ